MLASHLQCKRLSIGGRPAARNEFSFTAHERHSAFPAIGAGRARQARRLQLPADCATLRVRGRPRARAQEERPIVTPGNAPPTTRKASRLLWWFAAALVLAGTAASAEERPEPGPADRYPGPPLWRVSKGEHVLWLFGTLSSVPRDMKWTPAAVESVIAGAQEVLSPPGVRATPSMKPVQLVRLWRRVRDLSASPDGKRLAEVVPAELYRRYAVQRDRYVRRDRNLELQRPIIVVSRVYEDALEAHGLVPSRDIESGIERVARRAGVKVTDTKLHADPDVLLDHAARVPAPAELDCFARVLATVEDERRIVQRARAWATGDVAALRRFDYRDIRRDCLAFPGWPKELADALDGANAKWLESAERALAANRVTFGAVDLRELISPRGLAAQLRERGYAVQAP
jgi:uncharacterized protein YbaP (TraB family)